MPKRRRPNQNDKIQAAKNRLEAIVNVTSIALGKLTAVRDKEGTIIDFEYEWVNEAGIKLSFNCTGMHMLRAFPETRDNGLFQLMVKTTETGEPIETDFRYKSEHYNLWLHYKFVKLDDGLMFSCEDITQRRKDGLELLQLKDALAEQATQKYLTLLNNIVQGFCIIEVLFNAAGETMDYRFLEINPQFEKQTGLQNAVGKTMKELQPAHEESWFHIYSEVVKTGKPLHFENQAAHLNAGVWYDVFALPFDDPAKHQVAIFFNDITARKRQEHSYALLAAVMQELDTFTNSTIMMEVLGKTIGEYFEVKWCTFTERNPDGNTCTVCGWNADDVASLKGTHHLRDYLSPGQDERDNAGELTIIKNTRTDPKTNTELYAPMGIWSFIVIPITRDGEWKFRFSIIDTKIREWREDEITLLRELASRIWVRLKLITTISFV